MALFRLGFRAHVNSYSSPSITLLNATGSQAGLLICVQLITGLLLVSCSVQAGAYETLTKIERSMLELDYLQHLHALGATLTCGTLLLHFIRNIVMVGSMTGNLLRTLAIGLFVLVVMLSPLET